MPKHEYLFLLLEVFGRLQEAGDLIQILLIITIFILIQHVIKAVLLARLREGSSLLKLALVFCLGLLKYRIFEAARISLLHAWPEAERLKYVKVFWLMSWLFNIWVLFLEHLLLDGFERLDILLVDTTPIQAEVADLLRRRRLLPHDHGVQLNVSDDLFDSFFINKVSRRPIRGGYVQLMPLAILVLEGGDSVLDHFGSLF